MDANVHVVPFLSGRQHLPRRQMPYCSRGEPSEARMVAERIGHRPGFDARVVAWLIAAMPPARRASARTYAKE